MTEFEQQVAKVLGPRCAQLLLPVTMAAHKLGGARDMAGITKYRAELNAACDALYDGLAPCVAAALDAAAKAMEDHELGRLDLERDRDEQIRERALAALRGAS